MRRSKKHQSKPNLKIQIEDFERRMNDFRDNDGKNNVVVKPLSSAKNCRNPKKFSFEQGDERSKDHKFEKLHQLEEEKLQLLQSLHVLKASAVSAIAQKDDQIDRLKSIDHFNVQQKLEFFEAQLYRSEKLRAQVEDQREQLHKDFIRERSKYISELEEKEYLIETLYEEIQGIRQNNQALEVNDSIKTKKIKLLLQENSRLSVQLEQLSLSNSIRQFADRSDLNQTIKYTPPSMISSISSHIAESLCQSAENILSQPDKTYYSQKFQAISKTHKEDLIQLRNFYQKRIASLRQIYQRQLKLTSQESQQQASQRSVSISHSHSKKNLQSKSSRQDNPLALNLKDMYSIQQHAEQLLDTERTKKFDLKYEIRMQNLSQCPSVEPRLKTQEDFETQSQFTTKYFQNPFRFMKKNKSSSTFHHQQSKTVLRIKKQDSYSQKSVPAASPSQPPVNPENFWDKTKFFAVGLLSGVTITSFAGYFLRNK